MLCIASAFCTSFVGPFRQARSRPRAGSSTGIAPEEVPRGDTQHWEELNEEYSVTVTFLGGKTSKRRLVRRQQRGSPEERWLQSAKSFGVGNYRRMAAYCSHSQIDEGQAVRLLETEEGFRSFGASLSIVSYTDVLHCRFASADGGRDAFIFPYGPVVLWGFSAEEERFWLRSLDRCAEPIYTTSPDAAPFDDTDFMLYSQPPPPPGGGEAASVVTKETLSSTRLDNNIIALATRDPIEKLAISFAFAQSAKLSVLESTLDATTEEIRPIPEQLARSGRSQFSVKQIAKLSGRVFLERNEANLYSDILDCPAFFWEAEGFEPLYARANRYLDIDDRVKILNGRLDIVNDLLDSLSGQLEIRNSHRLEWIIIVLITVEIVISVCGHSVPPIWLPVRIARRLFFPGPAA